MFVYGSFYQKKVILRETRNPSTDILFIQIV